MARAFISLISLMMGIFALFSQGCVFQGTLTPYPSRPMDTWLLGVWKYSDTQGNRYRAGVFPLGTTHYSIEVQPLSGPDKRLGTRYFKAFISRVDQMYFLNLLPMESPQSVRWAQQPGSAQAANNIILLHYQLQSPIEVLVTPLDLSVPGHPLPWKLRREVRIREKAGTLLVPRKSTFWVKVSEVYWQKNASLESQPYQILRIPIPNPNIPEQDAAITLGPRTGVRANQ